MAFETGCHVTDAVKDPQMKQAFEIATSSVFDHLMQTCISKMDGLLDQVPQPAVS